MENKKNELQSRREFFKKAAKGALPFLGAIVLANTSLISLAAEGEPMGCKYGCANTCYTSCSNGCDRLCLQNCFSSCSGGCKSSSKY